MLNDELILKMAEFNSGKTELTQHLLKVFQYAHVIGIKEGLDAETIKILDMASIMHDIGIRPAMEQYGSAEGKLQEQVGPPYARKMLRAFEEVTPEETDRVCLLISVHHTYSHIEGIDHQILLEADYLVNAFEGEKSKADIRIFRDKIFRTKTGTWLLNTTFGLE